VAFLDDIDNDLRSILGAEFSITFSLQVGSLNYADLKGIFDETFLDVDNEGAPIQSDLSQLSFYVKTIDDSLTHELSEEDEAIFTIQGKEYIINHIERYGEGQGRVILKKKAELF